MELKEKLQNTETKNSDLRGRLAKYKTRCDEQDDKIEDLGEKNSELKGDLFVANSKLKNSDETLTSVIQYNAALARSDQQQRERADTIQVTLTQSITVIKEILPPGTPVAPDATLSDLTRLVISHHQSMTHKLQAAQAEVVDVNADFKDHEKKVQKTVADCHQKMSVASRVTAQFDTVSSQLVIAQQHASKLPSLQAGRDKHYNNAKKLHTELESEKVSLEKFGNTISAQSAQISQMKKEIAELNLKTGGDDSEAVKNLKHELAMAKYEHETTKIELREAKRRRG